MRLLGFGLALILGASQPAWAECRMAIAATLPVTQLGSRLTVQAVLDGRPAQLLFDTGAYTSVLSLAAVDRIGLHLLKSEEFDAVHMSIAGIGGRRSAIGVVAHTIELGGLHAKDYNFIAADVVRPPLDGLLSADLVSQFDIDLDLPEHQVQLFRPMGDCSAPAAFLSGSLYEVPLLPIGDDRRPRLRVTVGGQSLVAMLDTGASHSAIFSHAAERLGLVLTSLGADGKITGHGIGPRTVTGVRHALAPLSIGDLEIDNMAVDILDARADDEVEILLGADFLRAVHAWISYSSHAYPAVPAFAVKTCERRMKA